MKNTATQAPRTPPVDTPFAMMPEWLLDAPVSDRAVRLYGILARHADHADGRNAIPKRRTLAERLRCSPSAIDRALRELVAVGAIDRVERFKDGRQTSSSTTVHRRPRPLRPVPDPAPDPVENRPGVVTADKGGVVTGDEGGSSRVTNHDLEPVDLEPERPRPVPPLEDCPDGRAPARDDGGGEDDPQQDDDDRARNFAARLAPHLTAIAPDPRDPETREALQILEAAGADPEMVADLAERNLPDPVWSPAGIARGRFVAVARDPAAVVLHARPAFVDDGPAWSDVESFEGRAYVVAVETDR